MLIIGIDLGASGAIAFLNDGQLFDILDMPIDEVKVGKTVRKRINPARLADILRANVASHIYLEKVGPTPHDGAASAFAFGKAAMAPEMAAAALRIPYTLITPQEWKAGVRCPADKGAACKRASELFPAAASMFYGPRGGPIDGRAEAAMIAMYGDSLQKGGAA